MKSFLNSITWLTITAITASLICAIWGCDFILCIRVAATSLIICILSCLTYAVIDYKPDNED